LISKISDAQVTHFDCPFIDDNPATRQAWTCSTCPQQPLNPADLVFCAQCGSPEPSRPPPGSGCETKIEDGDVEVLVDELTMAKLRRFREMQGNDRFRECPKCQSPDAVGPGPKLNKLTCGECGHVHCFVHSDQHPGLSCQQFERSVRAVGVHNMN
jgi:hypothetical protein